MVYLGPLKCDFKKSSRVTQKILKLFYKEIFDKGDSGDGTFDVGGGVIFEPYPKFRNF